MSCTADTISKLHKVEDDIIKMPGLYTFWSLLYVAVLACLSVDDTTGSSRDFLMILGGVSTIFPAFAGLNIIYGNKLPSTMFLTVGPIYQYLFWQLLAYYRADVYGTHPIGILNTVFTVFSALFTVDTVIKTWTLTCNNQLYLNYVASKN
jgi:hypothetical protein